MAELVTFLLMKLLDMLVGLLQLGVMAVVAAGVALLKAAQSLVIRADEVVGELMPGVSLEDSALGRAAVIGLMGLGLWLAVTLVGGTFAGLWVIPVSFGVLVGGAVVVGMLADPEREFSFKDFPLWKEDEEPKLPLNL
jgi:hypothetical protein